MGLRHAPDRVAPGESMNYRIIFALAVAALVSNAEAQVFRCLDRTGNPIFSDKQCAANQSGGQILRKRSQREIYDERMQAGEAENRKQARRLAEMPIQADAPSPGAAYAPVSAPSTRLNSWGCTNAQRSYKITAGAKHKFAKSHAEAVEKERANVTRECGVDLYPPQPAAAPAARNMPPPAPPPPPPMPPGQVVNCDPAGCWDTNGNRLTNAAGGNFHRSDGKFCTRAGPNVVCN